MTSSSTVISRQIEIAVAARCRRQSTINTKDKRRLCMTMKMCRIQHPNPKSGSNLSPIANGLATNQTAPAMRPLILS